jgi:hypothetical protein
LWRALLDLLAGMSKLGGGEFRLSAKLHASALGGFHSGAGAFADYKFGADVLLVKILLDVLSFGFVYRKAHICVVFIRVCAFYYQIWVHQKNNNYTFPGHSV